MSKGFSSPSLLASWRAATFVPALTGAKRTVKVVTPPGSTGVLGGTVTVNWAASTPLKVMGRVSVRLASPELVTVKTVSRVLPTSTVPKSLAPPSAMSTPTGCWTAISGALATVAPVPLKVTPALNARARPSMVLLVCIVMAWSARMVPLKTEDVPSTAEVPTCQNTFFA